MLCLKKKVFYKNVHNIEARCPLIMLYYATFLFQPSLQSWSEESRIGRWYTVSILLWWQSQHRWQIFSDISLCLGRKKVLLSWADISGHQRFCRLSSSILEESDLLIAYFARELPQPCFCSKWVAAFTKTRTVGLRILETKIYFYKSIYIFL